MSVQYQNKHDFSFNFTHKIKTPIRDFMWCIAPIVFTAYLIGASAVLHVGIRGDNQSQNYAEQITVMAND